MRFEVSYLDPSLDGRARLLAENLRPLVRTPITELRIVDVYMFDSTPAFTSSELAGIFSDPVVQRIEAIGEHTGSADFDLAIETAYRAGVTDPASITAKRVLVDMVGGREESGADWIIQTARQLQICSPGIDTSDSARISKVLFNPLVQLHEVISGEAWDRGDRFPVIYPHTVAPSSLEVEEFDLTNMSDLELEELSRDRLLALSAEELSAIRGHYAERRTRDDREAVGLRGTATDVEIEVVAQTWSEHCKHKILNARIDYTDTSTGETEEIDSLFATYIRGTTERLSDRCGYLRSVFHDDSGVIAFDDETLLCFKVETHNSPSALDPYGGAITGIVGVNRDILGTGKSAMPIFNTNVLCFADPETEPGDVPPQLLHPRDVLRGVHRGIVDGGNQSGIPVVGGAFLFDPSYLGKPLVFCGTGGILPAEIGAEGAWVKHVDPGDQVVMVGGRIGKDGIHGATFSSLALDESSPTSVVQIGDPITQKLMADFLIEARDRLLFKGITDNGAGGLSSSLGEMAELAGGVEVDLDACPLKYPGLAPWEIFVSESQERMSLAVNEEALDGLLDLARRREVEATVIGRFNDSGYLTVRSNGVTVCSLALEFLHHGLPKLRLEATWDPTYRFRSENQPEPKPNREAVPPNLDLGATMLALLRDPNIASKEPLIRQYDHEVQGRSVVKPFVGVDSSGPSDGAVIGPIGNGRRGISVTHGICPRVGDIDTFAMAMCAVDEAYRAHIALGGDPDFTSALDNFCWSDPISTPQNPHGAHKLAQLVRACKGVAEACSIYGIPLISGKDSMKNDARIGDMTISIRPTLLISLMGIIPDIDKVTTSDFKRPGDLIYVCGETFGALAGTSYERIWGISLDRCPSVDAHRALSRYRMLATCISGGLVASVHDCSDGGVGVALAESVIGGGCGAEIELNWLPARPGLSDTELLFDESPSRFVVSVSPELRGAFEAAMGSDTKCVGSVSSEHFRISRDGVQKISLSLKEIEAAFGRTGQKWG